MDSLKGFFAYLTIFKHKIQTKFHHNNIVIIHIIFINIILCDTKFTLGSVQVNIYIYIIEMSQSDTWPFCLVCKYTVQ